jgi:WD40 repeat protein
VPGLPAAFMSYARFNDEHDDGQLTLFRQRLAAEVRAQTGQEFPIFQDRDIAWGQNWQHRIDEALDTVTLLVVIITPGFFASTACREETARFLRRERKLGRDDLILPVYYISAWEMDDPAVRDRDELARELASRQYADWRELRFEPVASPLARKAIAQLASRLRTAARQPADAPAPARPAARPGHHAVPPPASTLPATAPSHLIRTLTDHTGGVYGVAFSPDGTHLATTSHDSTARLWDIATGRAIRTLTGHTDRVYGVAFSPDGTLLATASYDNTARLWA